MYSYNHKSPVSEVPRRKFYVMQMIRFIFICFVLLVYRDHSIAAATPKTKPNEEGEFDLQYQDTITKGTSPRCKIRDILNQRDTNGKENSKVPKADSICSFHLRTRCRARETIHTETVKNAQVGTDEFYLDI